MIELKKNEILGYFFTKSVDFVLFNRQDFDKFAQKTSFFYKILKKQKNISIIMKKQKIIY